MEVVNNKEKVYRVTVGLGCYWLFEYHNENDQFEYIYTGSHAEKFKSNRHDEEMYNEKEWFYSIVEAFDNFVDKREKEGLLLLNEIDYIYDFRNKCLDLMSKPAPAVN